jgi:hypothetical protein
MGAPSALNYEFQEKSGVFAGSIYINDVSVFVYE